MKTTYIFLFSYIGHENNLCMKIKKKLVCNISKPYYIVQSSVSIVGYK